MSDIACNDSDSDSSRLGKLGRDRKSARAGEGNVDLDAHKSPWYDAQKLTVQICGATHQSLSRFTKTSLSLVS